MIFVVVCFKKSSFIFKTRVAFQGFWEWRSRRVREDCRGGTSTAFVPPLLDGDDLCIPTLSNNVDEF